MPNPFKYLNINLTVTSLFKKKKKTGSHYSREIKFILQPASRVQRPFCHSLKMISGRAEEYGKVIGVFVTASLTDFSLLFFWSVDTQYVTFSSLALSVNLLHLKKIYCLALGKLRSFEEFHRHLFFCLSYTKKQIADRSKQHSARLDVKQSKYLKSPHNEKNKTVQGLKHPLPKIW